MFLSGTASKGKKLVGRIIIPAGPSIVDTFVGRRFIDNIHYPTIHRVIVYRSGYNWLYTVEIVKDITREGIDTGKKIVRIARWQAINDSKNKDIKYWVQRRGYNVRSQGEWISTSGVVNSLFGTAKEIDIPEGIKDEVNIQLIKAQEFIQQLEKRIKELKDINSTYAIEKEAYKARYRVIKRNIRDYKKILTAFKELIERENATETDVHNFIEVHKAFWLFGLEYTDMLSRKPIPLEEGHYKDVEFDLLLKRQDLFWDLVELKGPSVNLFDKRTSHRLILNKELSEALSQIITYMDICDTHLKDIINVFKPKAIIVIGRKDKDIIRFRRLFSSYLNNIEVITYTDLYERGKALLDYINGIDTHKLESNR